MPSETQDTPRKEERGNDGEDDYIPTPKEDKGNSAQNDNQKDREQGNGEDEMTSEASEHTEHTPISEQFEVGRSLGAETETGEKKEEEEENSGESGEAGWNIGRRKRRSEYPHIRCRRGGASTVAKITRSRERERTEGIKRHEEKREGRARREQQKYAPPRKEYW